MIERPVRLDGAAVEALAAVLAAQRRLEDAVGPAAVVGPMTAQLDAIAALMREASGPHRDPLARVVAEWTVWTGWLHAALRRDAAAVHLFRQAEKLADEVGDGTVAELAAGFRGYVARKQGRHRAVVRASHAALATPGAHPALKVFDTLQAAKGYAALGADDEARRLLDTAAKLIEGAGTPPPPAYWYTPAFFRLNIGVVHHELGDHATAADHLANGLDALPAEQRGAEWADEYREFLAAAKAAS
ncbi:hypothetical protein [Allonocardiopsis opalescens]|uniref:hypothetical protein n=1 Tax=Allonocardiopsis opalescens TaxID=1144618 RepID=UPI00147535ED|nr:hypothetical protein [Allonocardiopsis opalescens]